MNVSVSEYFGELVLYLLYGSGAGEVQAVVPLGLTVTDDQEEGLIQ